MKILAPLLRYDYGEPARGESLEKKVFLPALAAHAEVRPLWLEDHGWPLDHAALQRTILEEARAFQPDLVFFILMKDEVALDTLKRLAADYKTINWFCDDQWRFESFTRHVAPVLTYSITVDKYSVAKYRAIGCHRVIHSQWAASDEYFAPDPGDHADGAYECDVSFVGSWNLTRQWVVDTLARNGIFVACYGSGWPNGRIGSARMLEIFRRSRINLNLSNSVPRDHAYRAYAWRQTLRRATQPGSGTLRARINLLRSTRAELGTSGRHAKRAEQMKARPFEIAAAGGFQLCQFCLEIEDYFVPGQEIVLFSSVDELATLIGYYLAHEVERATIRRQALERCRQHTYTRRIGQILQSLPTC